MMFLLDEADQRRIKLMEILMQQSGWITIGELARLVDASERTIHSDLIDIKTKWGQKLQIDISLKNGVNMGCHNAAMLHEIQIDIFKSSVAPRFLRDLFFFPHQDIEFYTAKLFISKSTLIRLIPRINAYLSALSITIERTGLNYCLNAGDELALRKLLSSLYLELNPPLAQLPGLQVEWPVPGARKPISYSRIYEIVCAMLRKGYDQEAVELVMRDASALPQMVAFYFVSVLREYQGFTLPCSRPLGSELSKENFAYLAERFPSITPEQLQSIHAILMKPFQEPDDPDEELQLTAQATDYFSRVFDALHVTCPPKIQRQLVTTMKILYHFAVVYPAPLPTSLRRINGFISSLQRTHPKLYAAFSDNLAAFNRALKTDLTPSLPDLMLHACFLFPALGMASPTRRVFIVSDFGIEHTSFIANFIQSAMNSSYFKAVQVMPIPYTQASDPAFASSLTAEDIFVTTAPAFLGLAPGCRTLLFHDFPSMEDFCQLYEAIYLHT